VSYGGRELYPFYLTSSRLKEHILIAGRSGSGKTNLTFVLMDGIISSGIKVLALDWKRGYRDLMSRHRNLRVYTIGRDIAPFRFNPLIPPAGCEPHLWIKRIVDVMASAYRHRTQAHNRKCCTPIVTNYRAVIGPGPSRI